MITKRTGKALAIFVVVLLGSAACAGPEENPITPSTSTTTPPPELPRGDGELSLASILSLSGANRADGLAQLAGIELAIREINTVATQELLGGVEGQKNGAFGKTLNAHYRFNDISALDRDAGIAALQSFSKRGVDLILGPGNTPEASVLLDTAAEIGIPLILPNQTPGSFDQNSAGFILAGGHAPDILASSLFGAVFETLLAQGSSSGNTSGNTAADADLKISYLYLPDEQGNAINRTLKRLGAERDIKAASDEKSTEKTSETATQTENSSNGEASTVPVKQTVFTLPIILDPEVTAESLAALAVQSQPDILALYLPRSEQALSLEFVAALLQQSGIQPQMIVLIDQDPAALREAAQAAETAAGATEPGDSEALVGIRGISFDQLMSAEFAAKSKQVDPWTGANFAGQQAYDAVIRLALARLLADDDNGQRIAAKWDEVTSGAAECFSYAECVYVLNTRQDIAYRGSAAHYAKLRSEPYQPLPIVEVQQDNSLTVLNGTL
ncbi:MAG: hypothetical protein WBA28_05110 [Microbacteriaceae bacterium]